MFSNGVLITVMVVFIVFGSLLGGLGIVCWTIVKLLTGGARKQVSNDEESQLIQEIHHGLSKMGERVEVLETLLLEREKREER